MLNDTKRNLYKSTLSEFGIPYQLSDVAFLSEAAQLAMTDSTLSSMMKFITDKYNSLDFSEIEKSAGDIHKFKYTDMLYENTKLLSNIYSNSPDKGASKYIEVTDAISDTLGFLDRHRDEISTLYKAGNGVIQLMYTSLVAACIYATGTLISNTIRFVTTEQNTECEVLFEEIPGTIRHVHIKNIMAVHKDLNSFRNLLIAMAKPDNRKTTMHESITASSIVTVLAVGAGVVILVPRILVLIREIIYSIYYNRVKLADMLAVQVDLIRTNVESLESKHGNKKVIARQKNIANKLEAWKNRVALKMDTTETLKRAQINKENASLGIKQNDPAYGYDNTSSGILL